MPWSSEFDDPIVLPNGRKLLTLKDAGNYITKLPKAEHDAPEWQAAMEALILVAENGGPAMFARIGFMRGLNRHVPRTFNPDRKDVHWGQAEAEEGPMTDQELIITALRQSGVIIAEHLEPGNQIDADETIARLIAILDRQDLAAAMDRLEGGHGLRVVK